MINLALPRQAVKYNQPDGKLTIEAVFRLADATASMVRTRLSSMALQKVKEDESSFADDFDNSMLFVYTYPDFVAALCEFTVDGVDPEGQPFHYDAEKNIEVDFALYRQLPEVFLIEAEGAIYTLNPGWKKLGVDDPKVTSAVELSTTELSKA